MDPVTASAAASAGLSLYQAGGLALVLLAIIVVGAFFMARFLMSMIGTLGARLNAVQDAYTKQLVGVIGENTEAMRGVHGEVARQTIVIAQQTEAMRGRPCLIGSGAYERPAQLPASGPR